MAEQLSDVSLPDENMAWADMKRRLEKDDDDRVIPFWLNGCFLWTLIGVVMLGLGWWIVRPEHWFERRKTSSHQTSKTQPVEEQQHALSPKTEPQLQHDSTIFFSGRLRRQKNTVHGHTKEIIERNDKREMSQTFATKNNFRQNDLDEKKKRAEQVRYDSSLSNNKNPISKSNQVDAGSSDSLNRHLADNTETVDSQNVALTKANSENLKKDSVPQNATTTEKKRDSSKSPAFYFAAGLSLFQQLPIGGQSFVPYDREGRKGTLADYIPSVHVRMYHRKNWFIQSEFRYGAPQYTKEFVYQQKVDSNSSIIQYTSLRKTYYHQLPLSFNYYISKNLSIGTGIVWNRFVSAIASHDIVHHNNITGTDSIISKETILVPKNDSSNVFVRSWFQTIVQAEYKWKRFSLGARYAVGLEPYIKFELQPGVPQQEKNSSLDIFIRYELWRSKKK